VGSATDEIAAMLASGATDLIARHRRELHQRGPRRLEVPHKRFSHDPRHHVGVEHPLRLWYRSAKDRVCMISSGRCPIHVDDIAEVFVRVLMTGKPRQAIYNPGGQAIPLAEIVTIVRG
jgi:nucleoside-diphosphate-sugar epimerase